MFGEYVKVHKENTITNSMKPRTRPAFAWGQQEIYKGPLNLYVWRLKERL